MSTLFGRAMTASTTHDALKHLASVVGKCARQTQKKLKADSVTESVAELGHIFELSDALLSAIGSSLKGGVMASAPTLSRGSSQRSNLYIFKKISTSELFLHLISFLSSAFSSLNSLGRPTASFRPVAADLCPATV